MPTEKIEYKLFFDRIIVKYAMVNSGESLQSFEIEFCELQSNLNEDENGKFLIQKTSQLEV